MSRIPELDSQRPELEKYVTNTAARMGESAFCLTLFTEDYAKGLDSMLQFACAVMLDKPLFLMVPNGVKIPKHVEKIADGIERYDPDNKDSMEQATHRLLQKAREQGLTE